MRAELMKRSKLFWTLVIVTGLYFIAREGAQLAIHAGWLDLGLPEDVEAIWIGGDLRINVDAAHRLTEHEQLYYEGDPPKFEVYNYTPFYALALSQITTRLPFTTHAFLHALVSLAAYIALFFSWRRLFVWLGVPGALETTIALLPIWFIYTAWWGDAILLNLYVILALAASWLFYFLWQEKLWPAALILILIFQVKPQWGFGLMLPLLMGRFRFFAKLVAVVLGGYILVAAATILWLGPDYGLAQYGSYYEMLATHTREIPWHGPGEFIGYDHSIAQIYFYLFGYDEAAWPIVGAIKLAILGPLGVATVLLISRERNRVQWTGSMALEAFFALYLAAFIWLDLVWEITLSIVIFTYLMTVTTRREARWLIAVPFSCYAIADLWQVIGIPLVATLWGETTVASQGPPLWADPSFHIPIIMFVILSFYGLLVGRLLRLSWPTFRTVPPERAMDC